jgi:hypothetical protein
MGKHRLEGNWYSPSTSTVFVCDSGEVRCSRRGFIGWSKKGNVQIGTAWDSVHENRYHV